MRSLLSLAAVSCVAVATSAQAADLYLFPNFRAVGDGQSENPKVKGSALLLYDNETGMTTAILSLRKLSPNTQYGAFFGNDNASSEPWNAMISDSKGDGAFIISTALPMEPTDPPSAFFFIYRDLDNSGSCDANELRAAGVPF